MKKGVFLFYLLFSSASIFAGGFEMSLNGYRYLGMGYAGTGLSLDASSIYINPGALSFIRNRNIQFGAGAIRENTSFLARTPSLYTANMDERVTTPFYVYLAWRLKSSRFTFGLGVNNPYGYQSQWPLDWKGRFIVQESSLNTLFIQPTISYQLNEKWGIGFGIMYGIGNFSSRKSLPFSGPNNQEAFAVLSGEGNGFGVNIGTFFKPDPRVSIGLNLRSPVFLDVSEGSINFNVPASLEEFFPNGSFVTEYPLPGSINLGIGYELQQNITLAFEMSFQNWDILDTLKLKFDENLENAPSQPFEEDIILNFKPSYSFRMGAEWKINSSLFFRSGLYFDLSPVRDDFLSPEYPDADRIGTTAGLGMILFDQFQLDIAYVFEYKGERTDILENESFGGTYASSSNSLGFGVGFLF